MNPRLTFAALAMALASGSALAQGTANIGVSNNYLWRGLTQSNNEVAVSGGFDWAASNGFYAGTWVSNVEYASDDTYSYEHDIYLGYSGSTDRFTYDVGWLYYNYDSVNNFDFHEIYGTLGWRDLSLSAYVLSGTEADESPLQDFGFGSTTYLSLDYGFELGNGLGIGLHLGRHNGDFNEAFNGVPGAYTDYNISFSMEDFTFTISDTNLADAGPFDNLDNDSVKFVVSYSKDFSLAKD
jgi:uncharacterized protein (TIGR02001 family)